MRVVAAHAVGLDEDNALWIKTDEYGSELRFEFQSSRIRVISPGRDKAFLTEDDEWATYVFRGATEARGR